jgi:tripeptidyl-peptidase I
MKLALQGVTVVVSSGDNGVGSHKNDPTPSGCLGARDELFNPEFLSNCPYILAVGGTEFVRSRRGPNRGKITEQAVTGFESGGGFSNVHPMPDYQKQHVEEYLATADLDFHGYEGGGTNYSNIGRNGGKFNTLGRAYPDVAAVGDNIYTVYRARAANLMGTSASAPIFAAMLNLINEERLAVNKSTVGFVHPVLVSCLIISIPKLIPLNRLS